MTKSAHQQTLSTPLENTHKIRMERDVSYQKEKQQITNKWVPFVEVTQTRSQLKFPLEKPIEALRGNEYGVVKAAPETSFEEEVQSILQQSEMLQLPEEQVGDDIGSKVLTPEEEAERQRELRKIQLKLSYLAQKNIHAAKIKSKKYHRLKKREKERKKLSLEQLRELNPELARKEEERRELARLHERVSQRHSRDKSKIAKKDTTRWKPALDEQNRIHQELLRRTGAIDSEDESETDDEEEMIKAVHEPSKSAAVRLVQNLASRAPASNEEAEETFQAANTFSIENVPHSHVVAHQKGSKKNVASLSEEVDLTNVTISELSRTATSMQDPEGFETPEWPEPQQKQDFYSKLKSKVLQNEIYSAGPSKPAPAVAHRTSKQISDRPVPPVARVPSEQTISEPSDNPAQMDVSSSSFGKREHNVPRTKHELKPNTTPPQATFDSDNPWLTESAPSRALTSKREKKVEKTSQVRINPEDTIQIDSEQVEKRFEERTAPEMAKKRFHLTSNADSTTKEMIQRAFADTPLQREWEKEKEEYLQEIEETLSSKKSTTLPGWNSWAGEDIPQATQKPQLTEKQSQKVQQKMQTINPNTNVIIFQNTINKSQVLYSDKYKVKDLKGISMTDYKQNLETKLSKEMNTASSHLKKSQARISVTPGVVIAPPAVQHYQAQMDYAQNSGQDYRFVKKQATAISGTASLRKKKN